MSQDLDGFLYTLHVITEHQQSNKNLCFLNYYNFHKSEKKIY